MLLFIARLVCDPLEWRAFVTDAPAQARAEAVDWVSRLGWLALELWPDDDTRSVWVLAVLPDSTNDPEVRSVAEASLAIAMRTAATPFGHGVVEAIIEAPDTFTGRLRESATDLPGRQGSVFSAFPRPGIRCGFCGGVRGTHAQLSLGALMTREDGLPEGTASTWVVPLPYGYPEAVAAGGAVGAPLLAGFTVTLIGIVIGYGSHMGAPGAALDVLSAAAVVLLLAVQFSFFARAYTVHASDMVAWWPDHANEDRHRLLVAEQKAHAQQHAIWATRFRRAYNFGVLLLLVGVSVALVPPHDQGSATARWLAVAIAGAGAVGELYWVVALWAPGLGPADPRRTSPPVRGSP
jgi:hypothetical protein